MFWNKKKPEDTETKIDRINKTPIEQLLEGCKYYYGWSLDETKAVLIKCTDILHVAELYKLAFKAQQHPNFNDNQIVLDEVTDVIYLSFCRSLNIFLKDTSMTDSHQIEYIKKIHEKLNCTWNDRENSNERIMLQKRLEVRWEELVSRVFETIQSKNPTTPEGFEQLFFLCNKSSSKILAIAGEINRLSV